MSFLRLRARLRSLLATGPDEVVKLAATCKTVPQSDVDRLEAKPRELKALGVVDDNHDIGCVYRYGAVGDSGVPTCKCKVWVQENPDTFVKPIPEDHYPPIG